MARLVCESWTPGTGYLRKQHSEYQDAKAIASSAQNLFPT